MRTSVVVTVLVVAVLVALALPSRSQEPTRIGAVIDITALSKRLESFKAAIEGLKKQNEELKKAVEEGNKTLDMIAAGVGVLRVPIRWEYRFVKSRSEKLANKYGAQGWELTNIFEDNWFVYRRPLPPKAAGEEAGEAAE